MNRKRVLIFTGVLLFLTGCTDFVMICSLNPFYLEKNVTLLPQIEGRWSVLPLQRKELSGKKEDNPVWKGVDTTSVWKIERMIFKETAWGVALSSLESGLVPPALVAVTTK